MFQKFETYKEAYQFWLKNKDSVPQGMVLTISPQGLSVQTRSIKNESLQRTSRPKDGHFTGYGSDTLPGGVNGIINHADGKRYDSKSQYERAVRAKGCRIVGNDFKDVTYKTPLERGIRGDFNVKRELKQAVEKVRGC